MGGRVRGRLVRLLSVTVLGLCVVLGAVRSAPAQDIASAERDVLGSSDFRVRVGAALTLGRAHPPDARSLLEKALADEHPAVRTAAAAALATLKDPAAIPALERRVASEASPNARAEMRSSIASLRRAAQGPDWGAVRYVVQLGSMKNESGVRGEQAAVVLRSATLARARSLSGAVVAEPGDSSVLVQANERHLPVLVLDGLLQHLTQSQRDTQLNFDARVEYIVRRMPDQMLRGSLSGAATSVGSLSALSNPMLVANLQNQAIGGAVESAMRGADRGLAMAAK